MVKKTMRNACERSWCLGLGWWQQELGRMEQIEDVFCRWNRQEVVTNWMWGMKGKEVARTTVGLNLGMSNPVGSGAFTKADPTGRKKWQRVRAGAQRLKCRGAWMWSRYHWMPSSLTYNFLSQQFRKSRTARQKQRDAAVIFFCEGK